MAKSSGQSNRRSVAVGAVVALLTISVFADFPKPSGPINDFAGVLDEPTVDALKTLTADVEAQTTAEIAVVTVTSLDGMSVEEYANRLFKEWGIGQKGADNGVLILVAPGERKMRIEVGYGLEGVLPDGLAGQIIREQFTPAFKESHYAEGILLGTQKVAEVVRRNHTLTPEERERLEKANANEPPLLLLVPFFSVFVVIGMATLAMGFRQKEGFFLLFGASFAGLPMLMSLVFSRKAFYIEAALALVVFVVALTRKKPVLTGFDEARSSSGSSRSWQWGAGSSSSSSRSGSSGGSSSSSSSSSDFGGGSSGGGGASGSW